MICNFGDTTTYRLWAREPVDHLCAHVQAAALDGLYLLRHEALAHCPGEHLQRHLIALAGDRAGQHAIGIGGDFFLCFYLSEDGAHDVELVSARAELLLAATTLAAAQPLPIHPGQVLESDFLRPRGIAAADLAREINLSQRRLANILAGRRGISVDTGLRLARALETSPEFWTDLQQDYDLRMAAVRRGA